MSGESLGRKSLGMLVAERLESDIVEGVWKKTLPGCRVLSKHYGVCIRTSREAVDLLEHQGLVAAPQQGKKREILISKKAASSSDEKMRLLIIVDINAALDSADEKLLSWMSEFWLKRVKLSGGVSRVAGDLGRYRRPRKLLQQWIEQHAATHLLVLNGPAAWLRVIDQLNIPCYYLGGDVEGAGVASDRHPGSAHVIAASCSVVFERLRAAGHTRLLAPLDLSQAEFRVPVLVSMISVYDGILSDEACELAIPIFHENDPDSWQRNWEREFLRLQPTGVIVNSHPAFVSLYAYCARNEILPGKDLVVVSMDEDEILEWFYPKPTYMRYPYRESLKDFKSWVRQGFPYREHTLLTMEWVEGDTT